HETGQVTSDGAYGRHRGGVVHTRGAQYAQLTHDVTARPTIAARHYGGLGEVLVVRLLPDAYSRWLGGDVFGHFGEQTQHHHLFLQRLQHRSDRAREVHGGAGQVGCARHHDAFFDVLAEHVVDGLADGGQQSAVHRWEGVGDQLEPLAYLAGAAAGDLGVDAGAQFGQEQFVDLLDRVDQPLGDPAVGGDDHHHDPVRAGGHELHVPQRRAAHGGVLHDGDLLGELCEQPHGALQQFVQVDGAAQQFGDGPAFGFGQGFDLGDLVHEHPVSLIGGDPAGGGVRLGDVALLLQHRHIVSDGGGRDAEVVPIDQVAGADGLPAAHIVLHDRSEDLH